MKRFSLVLLVAVLATLLSATIVSAGQEKVPVCHLDEDGNYILINIADPAVEKHIEHGDEIAGGNVLDGNCEPVSVAQEGCFSFLGPGWIVTTGAVQDISGGISAYSTNQCDDAFPPAYPPYPDGAWLIWATDLSGAAALCEAEGAGVAYSLSSTQTTNLYVCYNLPDPCTVGCTP